MFNDKDAEKLVGSLFSAFSPSSVKDVKSALPLRVEEPKNIGEAIVFYEERVRLLTMVLGQGFDTLEEYNEYKKAEEKIKQHKERVAQRQADLADMECMDKSQPMSNDDMGFNSPGHTEIPIQDE